MLASPDEFRGAARALRDVRVATENDRSCLVSADVVFERWKSPAADDLRQVMYQVGLNSMQFVIRDLGDLADMLDQLADALESKIASIHRIETNARHWFTTRPLPEDGSPPVWEREWWRYRPGRFPDRGDSEWLDAAAYLRARGVTC